nr:unnamed protein product [Callosobruchus chinensis]CAH7724522.1 unnamed protein product [Callosobruchus chinensis]CAH7737093.1 unnamed protein product [Callosobruchus chinensis]CAH7742700.1 unnamed protein product [Callosobruchus chinensis]
MHFSRRRSSYLGKKVINMCGTGKAESLLE